MATAFAGPLARHFVGARGDLARVRHGVETWRDDLRSAVADKVGTQLHWDEGADVAFTAELGDSGFLALRLLGLLADRPELEWPDTVPPLLELDAEWRAAAEAKFARSRYGQLLACQLWLPGEFPVTFRVPLPDGETAEVGSLQGLADQMKWLNQRTFQADADDVIGWRELPAPPGGEFVAAARRGFAGLSAAVDVALRHRLPVVVRQV